MTDVAVFVKPAARKGRGAARTDAALAALRAEGAEVRLVDTASPTDVRVRTRELLAAGATRIVVVGGDGLVHLVVQELAGTRCVLGVIPMGTGNDFAAALGLPTKTADAARVALGPARAIDLLRRDGGWAASVATVGFSAAVNERAELLRWPRGAARYSLATMLELPRLRPMDLVISLGDEDGPGQGAHGHRVQAALVAVANTAMFGGGMRICPDARPDDGLLDVTVIEAVGRFDLLRHFGRVFRGTHVRHRAVSVYRARAVSLATPALTDGTIRADGEAWGALPITIEVVPGALQLAAPPAAGVRQQGAEKM